MKQNKLLNKAIKRYKNILELHSKGISFREIGKKYKISGERVRQISLKFPTEIKIRQLSELEKYLMSVNQITGRSRAREMVRLRDNHTCQDCGLVRKTIDILLKNSKIKGLVGKSKSLDVHHLDGQCGKNSVGYDSPKDISKMITLCHKCHYNRPEHRVKSKKSLSTP